MRLLAFLGVIAATSIASAGPAGAQDLWQNSYGSPYSNGPSYTDGYGDYNDTTNTYGSPMGGPTIYSERENKTYQCDSYGTCYEAWNGL